MPDSDTDDSFHSCDEGGEVEAQPPAAPPVDEKKPKAPAASERKKEAVEKKADEKPVDSKVADRKPPHEEKPKPSERPAEATKKSTEDGWDRFGDGDDELEVSSGSGSEAEVEEDANSGDWDSWGDEQEERRPKVHPLKHHSTKREVDPEDSPRTSTEADNGVHPKTRPPHQNARQTRRPAARTRPAAVRLVAVGVDGPQRGGTLSNVVETGLGLPNAEEMAKLSVAQRRKLIEESQHVKEPEPSLSSDEANDPQSPSPTDPQVGGGFGGLFSGIVTGGLDVLETLGKKTFETLTVKDETDNDRRRFLLTVADNRQNLSDVLREVRTSQQREQSEESGSDRPAAGGNSSRTRLGYGSANIEKINTNFINLFEKAQGMVNLEGLELLCTSEKERTAHKKIDPAFDEQLAEFCVEDVSECPTEDFVYELKKCINGVGLPYKADNILQMDAELCAQLERKQQQVDEGKEIVVDEMHEAAIVALSRLTAHSIQALHKIAQLIVIADDRPELESLFAFTFVLCRRLSFYASPVDDVVTNIFFECTNACHYIKKALTLLRPFFVV
ncbi:85/88 kDa calcium-independent phospholipase A2 [Aphelenchoides fujianensis]|nr:85/88 kDa calcium-independent phospholipase A2 [Aphelenchoides fujianensis]